MRRICALVRAASQIRGCTSRRSFVFEDLGEPLAHVLRRDRDLGCAPMSGASKDSSSSRRSIIVCSRRAPMFSMRSLTIGGDARDLGDRVVGATRASRPRSRAAPRTAWSARSPARSGCGRSRRSVSGSSSTRIGKRPCSSGIRSDGLDDVERAGGDEQHVVGLHRRRTWSCTVEPSTIGSRSRCTPSRETSGPPALPARAGDLVDLVEEDDAAVLDAVDRLARDLVHVDQLARPPRRSSSSRASGTFTLRRLRFVLRPNIAWSMSCTSKPISSMPCGR